MSNTEPSHRPPVTAATICLIATVVIAGLLYPAGVHGQQIEAEIVQILDEMAAEGPRFQPGRLHAMGLQGLSMVLDRLLPDTVDPKNAGELHNAVAGLIKQLGDDSYRLRQSATQELFQLGPGVKAYLVEATRDPEAEVSWRATQILRRWEAQRGKNSGRHVAAFAVLLRQIDDDQRIEELARCIEIAFRAGMPDGTKRDLLQACLVAVGRSENEEYSNMLAPLLKHEDVQVAVLVAESIGSASDGRFPAIMLEALRSDRDEVVTAAIRRVTNCADDARGAEVKRVLVSFFEGDDEPRKFQACFPLMHSFEHSEALDYLLLQVQSNDLQRRTRALAWIGDPCNLGRPASENLLKVFQPLLESSDHKTRRSAAGALAMYGGEQVVKGLLPLLDDPNAFNATKIGSHLLQQRDQAMLRRVLSAAAKDDPNATIRKRAAAVLDKLPGSG